MSGKKKVLTPVDLDKAYEDNTVGLKGILWFGGGLLALIVVTFALMAFFLGEMRNFATSERAKETVNPQQQTEREKLPVEPRLQSAPGFGVQSDKGWVNLELREPQAEYREMRKQWDELREKGRTDPKTGTVTAIPIDQAKERFLESSPKAASGPQAEELYKKSRMFVSDASSGREASETRR